jgi:hypothetical protein
VSTRYVVIGGTPLARRVCATLTGPDVLVDHLEAPGDADLRAASWLFATPWLWRTSTAPSALW